MFLNEFFIYLCSCTKPNEVPVHMEQLTPIDEEPSEDDANDEDQPITMIPKIPTIMHTAPSPTTENPPVSTVTSTSTVNNEQTPRHGDADSSVELNRSTTEPTIPEVNIENQNERKQSIPKEDVIKINDTNDNKVSQIESVL